jgi:hypothetical protein
MALQEAPWSYHGPEAALGGPWNALGGLPVAEVIRRQSKPVVLIASLGIAGTDLCDVDHGLGTELTRCTSNAQSRIKVEGMYSMTARDVAKIEIAREYLDAAIEFFLGRRNFFCAIHLAAAAEELFGAHLPQCQRISTLGLKAEKALKSETRPTIPSDREALRSVNEWKNAVKHMDDGTSHTLTIDPPFVAEHHIEQALINFYKLKLLKSAAVSKFEDHQNHATGWMNR